VLNFSTYIFVVFIKYEKSRDVNGLETESGGSSPPGGAGPLLAVPPCGESTPELVSVPVSSYDFVSMFIFTYITPRIIRGLYIMFSSCFCFDLFLSGVAPSFRAVMSSSGSSEENSLADIINPYLRELKMHPKELLLKDGKLQIEDVQGPTREGSLEARMGVLEQ
jgi:hypothetical protein